MISHLSFPFSLLLVLSLSLLYTHAHHICPVTSQSSNNTPPKRSVRPNRPDRFFSLLREPHKTPSESLSCIICAARMTACTLTLPRVIGGRKRTSYENEPNRNLVLLVFLLLCWVGAFSGGHSQSRKPTSSSSVTTNLQPPPLTHLSDFMSHSPC